MSSDAVHHSDEHGVRIVTINRPERKNAIDIPMRAVLADLMRDSHADPDVRAVVITGAGGTFCSGADVSGMEQLKDPEMARARVETVQNIARGITAGPTPVIAAVEGIAFGAGLGIALACDHIVAADDARLSAAFVNVGLFADIGVLFTLPQRVGPARARTMMLLAQMVHAEEALRIGLVDQLCEPGTALERATEVATKLAAGPPLAIAAVKKAFTGLPISLAESLETETAMQAPLLGSEDFLEAITAFGEKRRATFSGT
jgi:2-(1,2-epoxy-1,2-dihydrophenyl)acetyl-CoA isomerase